MKLLRRFKDELKLVLRDTDIIIALLVGPLAFTILFGCVYMKGYVENIPIAILDEDNTAISRTVIQQFNDSPAFSLQYRTNSMEELKELIQSRKVSMGIYIPSDFSKDISSMEGSKIVLLTDGTNIVSGNNVYAAATTIIQTVSAGTKIKILQAKDNLPPAALNMATTFNFNDRTLYDSRLLYINYLIFGFIALFLQQVLMSGVGISFIKVGRNISEKATIINMLIRILACSFYAIFSVLLAIYFVSKFLNITIRGNIGLAVLFCLIFSFAISCPSIIIASLIRDKVKYAQFGFMLSVPTFVTSGYIWPQDQTPQVLVVLVKIFWPLINFCKPFADLLFKGVFPGKAILGLLIYILVWMPIAVYFLKTKFKGCGTDYELTISE